MPAKSAIRAEAGRLQELLLANGARPVEPDILMPSATLLDLYGEDIRARAYVTSDPLRGEQMLRPDFTVAVVQAHLDQGGGAGRYTYAGEVFRRQEEDTGRPNEYIQVGYEVFGGVAADSDAEVFATIAALLAPLRLRPAIGDIGLIVAAIAGLETSERRKAALMRHIWRPARFRTLLGWFAKKVSAPSPLMIPEGTPHVGMRSLAEVAERLAALEDEAEADPVPAAQAAALSDLLTLSEAAPTALAQLEDLTQRLPSLKPAVAQFRARLGALEKRGVPVHDLLFEASYGRTSLEYYDGFVFGFYADGAPELPAVATGGRYDALTHALGAADLPAVGGVIRPGLALEISS